MIGSIWAWLVSGASWQGDGGIGHRLVEHLEYSVVVVLIASALAIPMGVVVGHSGTGRWVVTSANSARAVPTLGLLFAFSMWLGPYIHSDLAFVIPSIIALVLLAIPPILSGTYAGIEAVDPAARDAARGVGMTGGEVLRQVELPCALPLLLSGVRSAVLQVVATATLAAYVGMGGLGRFLVDGIASRDLPQTAGGALLVALLALIVEALLALLQRLVVSPGLTGRTTRKTSAGPGGLRAGKHSAPQDVDLATSV